jgi:hypothetical protein
MKNASTFVCNVRRNISSSFSQVSFLGSNLAELNCTPKYRLRGGM